MTSLNALPRDSWEREDWLWDYLLGKVTDDMVERLSQQLGYIVRGKASSKTAREAAEKFQALSREDFSAWVIDRFGGY